MSQGSFGELKVFEDFLHFEDNIAATGVATAIVFGSGYVSVGELGLVSVNEGSLAWTIDEPGGILALTSDTGDDDNCVLLCGPFFPRDGGMQMEVRFKLDNVTTLSSVFAGFSETMAFNTPVMPAEFATATMTINGTGGMAGLQFDIDGTTDDFRAVVADAGAMLAGIGAQGTRANATLTADAWYIVRVEIYPNGLAQVLFGDANDAESGLSVVATSTAVMPSERMYAVLMVENRTGAANVLEVDYFYARGWRDWRV